MSTGERDLAELLSAVRFRERNSQLLSLSDAAYQAGLRRIERDLDDPQTPRTRAPTTVLVSVGGDTLRPRRSAAYFEMKVSVPEFEAMLRRQFDTLYREGETIPRVMAIAVHPFVTGQPHRVGALDAALEYICSHAGVWRATGWEIVQHFLAQQSK